ncbi:hypothetical protein H920_07055 [Fukomys damarensis]|uniref:Uncharacterized protein n=1 Tax=Fukomys damarensis TaxID=885580 RepID=A0A091E8P0_FUKDA|nr:hypothetical protein H920_07055 [Fukomys damarensis]
MKVMEGTSLAVIGLNEENGFTTEDLDVCSEEGKGLHISTEVGVFLQNDKGLSASQSQFPAWTLEAFNIGYSFMHSGQQPKLPLSGWTGVLLDQGTFPGHSRGEPCPLDDLRAVAGLSRSIRSLWSRGLGMEENVSQQMDAVHRVLEMRGLSYAYFGTANMHLDEQELQSRST